MTNTLDEYNFSTNISCNVSKPFLHHSQGRHERKVLRARHHGSVQRATWRYWLSEMLLPPAHRECHSVFVLNSIPAKDTDLPNDKRRVRTAGFPSSHLGSTHTGWAERGEKGPGSRCPHPLPCWASLSTPASVEQPDQSPEFWFACFL